MAGGFFILVGIVAGAAWGIADGNPMKGVLIGTLVGMLIAAVVWVADGFGR